MVKVYTIGDESKSTVDFSLKNATETVKCRNCGARIAYSVNKNTKGEQDGRN